MTTHLTAEQIGFYHDNGFIAIENFLNDSELELWRNVTEDAVAQRLRDRSGFTNQSNPDDYYAQVFTQCVQLADTHDSMAQIIMSAELARLAATLAGIDGIRIWHDQALIKPPFGN